MDVVWSVIGQDMVPPVWIGLVVGAGAAVALARMLSGVLYGMSSTDPLTFGTVTILLVSIAFLACAVPARRAARVDPLVGVAIRVGAVGFIG